MHAYLIVGTDSGEVKSKIDELLRQLNVKSFGFPLAKIEDARSLNSFLKLKVSGPTAVIINSIEGATVEAANAFLKNLEEPQEDLYYILTAESIHKVLPTIVSRSQVLKVKSPASIVKNREAEKFLGMTEGEKLASIDQIRDRGEAKNFVRNLIETLHGNLHEGSGSPAVLADNLEVSQKTLEALEANGNVTLQLTNLVTDLK